MNRRRFLHGSLLAATLASVKSSLSAEDQPLIPGAEKAFDLGLKITDLKTFIVDSGNDENWVFVKIYTNQGLVGLGDGTMTAKAQSVANAIEEHKRYLVGKDPTEIERLWQGMFRGPRYRGGPILMSAISAIDIALWDILGQALNAPIWQLLGGKARDRIRVYTNGGWPNHSTRTEHRIWSPKKETFSIDPHQDGWIEREVAKWLKVKEAGFTACKGNFLPTRGNVVEPVLNVRHGIQLLEAVREAVGWEFDVLCELHGQATPSMARDFCNQAEPYQPMWVEEPGQLEVLAEWERLRESTSIPLATGERLLTKYEFIDLCSRHLVDFVQPDIVHCGGITEMQKIGHLAECFRVDLAPHNPQSEVSTVASMHICAATANAVILETGSGQTPYFKDLFNGGLFEVKDGYAALPDRPGLGITLNEEIASQYPYEPKPWHSPGFNDGAYADR